MEYSYTNLPDWFGKYSFKAIDDKVVISYRSLVNEVQEEKLYKDFNNKIVRGKQGNSAWTSIATTLVWLAVIGYLTAKMICPAWLNFQTFSRITFFSILLAVIVFSIRFIKEEFVWF